MNARHLGLLGLWLVLMGCVGILYLMVPVSPDQALFDYIAWSHLQGAQYYAEVAEQNWPGKMFMHELGIWIFGAQFWSFRAVDFVIMLGITLGGGLVLKRADFGVAPLIFGFLYPLLYISADGWMVGQRDIIAAGFLIIATALVLDRTRHTPLLIAGALVAFAVLFRPTYLSFLAGLVILEWLRFPKETVYWRGAFMRSLMLALGFVAPLAGLIGLAWVQGNLDDWYQQTITFNLTAYAKQNPRSDLIAPGIALILGTWHWIVALAGLGLILWVATKGMTRALIILLGLVATILLSYWAQNKGFAYHLGGLLPVFVLGAGVGVECLLRLFQAGNPGWGRRVALFGLVGALALMTAGMAKKVSHLRPHMAQAQSGTLAPILRPNARPNWAEIQDVTGFIKTTTAPEDYVLQWGRRFDIPYLAERRSSIRFVSTPALEILSDGFPAKQNWLDEIDRDLTQKPPALLIIQRAGYFAEGWPDATRTDLPDSILILLEKYGDLAPVLSSETFLVYQP